MERLDYLHFAEEDYRFAAKSYKAGIHGNPLGYLAEQACEKYAKHLYHLAAGLDATDSAQIAHFSSKDGHNPGAILKQLRDFDIVVPGKLVHEMNCLRSYNQDVRYPGLWNSHDLDADEERQCLIAMKHCREYTMATIRTIEIQRAAEKDNEEIDFGID